MNSNEPTPIQTTITEAPQLQTVVQDGLSPVTTIVDAPWVNVTSVNGMTGDVVVEAAINDFQSNHYYHKNTMIIYDGGIYYAKEDFTSGSSFIPDDWGTAEFKQEQANWSEVNPNSNSYIKNKPTKLTDFENDLDLITEADVERTVDGAISASITPLEEKVNSTATALENKVDKVPGKTLSTNDFTNEDKAILNSIGNLKAVILEQTYPVGSIFMSGSLSTAEAVNKALGGTWQAWGSGRVPVSYSAGDGDFGTIEQTGGAKTHTHTQSSTGSSTGSTGSASGNTGATTLTIDQIPAHTHSTPGGWGAGSRGDGYFRVDTNNPATMWSVSGSAGGGGSHTHSLNSHTHSLNSHTHTNPTTNSSSSLQPYIVCYMYKRIS